ncbi:SDR family oxidoreductase [Paraliobacillus sp. JSM ZJ581]|uniref:SDR family oxidoreductase n=1 Tax=Paraliobacillus sp. JSM ZJ581 TaxID=3342118 RepID=UPI0035A88BEA
MEKIALIFGGSGGVGVEICKKLIEKNITIYATYHNNKDNMNELTSYINRIKCNVTNPEEVSNVVNIVNEKHGKIDILINCVGLSDEAFITDKSFESWHKVIDTNLNSVFYSCRNVIPIMLENMSGVVINISSILGEFGIPGMTDYCAAKSAVIGFTKSLAAEVSRFDIRVNSISPGMLDTSMTKEAQKQIGKQVKRLVPMKRFGKSNEVASVVSFLISDESTYITGENIHIGGGLGRTLPVS